MHFQLVFMIFCSTLVHSLPTAPAANTTSLADGQAAQALNSQFATLTTGSACGNLTEACIGNAIATCTDDKFATSKTCLKGASCFAIPNFKNGGTTLTCTSQKNALSLIDVTGATGGITGTDSIDASGNSTDPKTGTANSASITAASPTATATGQDSNTKERITITVTRTLSQPTGFSSTRTIAPQEASSILSSLLANGGATIASEGSDAEETPCPSMKHHKTKTATTVPMPTPTGDTLATADAASTGAAPATASAVDDSSSGDGYSSY